LFKLFIVRFDFYDKPIDGCGTYYGNYVTQSGWFVAKKHSFDLLGG
jgi:hypothetical protein